MTRRSTRTAAVALSCLVFGAAVLADTTAGLRAVYFATTTWSHPVAVRAASDVSTDAITFDTPFGPDARFSVQWSGYLYVRRGGDYTVSVAADGPAALFIDRHEVSGDLEARSNVQERLTLDRGPHAISVWYAHVDGAPAVALRSARQDGGAERVSSIDLSPSRRSAVVYELGWLASLAAPVVLLLWLLAGAAWIVRRLRLSSAWVAGASVLFLLGAAYDTPSWLRGPAPYPYEWQWAYQPSTTVDRWMPAAFCALLLLGIVAWLARARSPRPARTAALAGLLAATLAGVGFQMALLHCSPDGAAVAVAQQTMSDDLTSYFLVANEPLSVREFLSTYATAMPDRSRHATSHPPGPILYHRAVIAAMRRAPGAAARILGVLDRMGVTRVRLEQGGLNEPLPVSAFAGGFGITLFAVLTAWPIFGIAVAAGIAPATAAQAAALWMFCPGPALFSPQFDQIVTFLSAATCALGLLALKSKTRFGVASASLGAGATAGLAVFSSFGALPMLAAAGVVALVLARAELRMWRRLATIVALAILSFAVVTAVPMLFGYDFFTTAREALAVSRYGYETRRDYALWLRFNLIDFTVFLGLPLVFWGAVGVVQQWRGRSAPVFFRADLFWAVTIFILLLDVTGVVRGEIGRLWMPLTPFAFLATVPLGSSEIEATSSRRVAERLLTGVLLAAVCVVLRLYWNPA